MLRSREAATKNDKSLLYRQANTCLFSFLFLPFLFAFSPALAPGASVTVK
jgi:hypothetical protein